MILRWARPLGGLAGGQRGVIEGATSLTPLSTPRYLGPPPGTASEWDPPWKHDQSPRFRKPIRSFAGELRAELGRLGATVQVVDDGNVGLQAASTDRPDLILLSIELPRMNGFSVCNKLKKDPHLKDVPLVIMSSESSEETFEQHRKLRTRAEDYIHKPIAFGELLQHIRAFVPLERPARPTPRGS